MRGQSSVCLQLQRHVTPENHTSRPHSPTIDLRCRGNVKCIEKQGYWQKPDTTCHHRWYKQMRLRPPASAPATSFPGRSLSSCIVPCAWPGASLLPFFGRLPARASWLQPSLSFSPACEIQTGYRKHGRRDIRYGIEALCSPFPYPINVPK